MTVQADGCQPRKWRRGQGRAAAPVMLADAPMEGQSAGVGLQEWVELAGDVADQAASDLAVGLALGPASLGLGPGCWVSAQPGRDDQVEGLVEAAIAGAIAPHPDLWPLEAGRGPRRRAWPRQRRVPSGRDGPGAPDDGGHDRADPAAGEQLGPPGPDQGGDGSGVVESRSVEELDAAGRGAQAGRGRGGLELPGRPWPEPPAGADQARRGELTQPRTKGIGAATTRAWRWRRGGRDGRAPCG